MNHNSSNVALEIEAKYLGGSEEFTRVIGWFTGQGFDVERKSPTHRLHVYFDSESRLQNGGCRLRCIVAPGEWVRYDFKADDPSGRRETLEICQPLDEPIALAQVVPGILDQLPEGPIRQVLDSTADALGITLVMTGRHSKTLARRNDLELELSWDVLSALDTGRRISEIEIEYISGSRGSFEVCVSRLERDLGLTQESRSKLDRMLAGSSKSL